MEIRALNSLVGLISVIYVQTYETNVNYMERKCGNTIYVTTSERIRLESTAMNGLEEDCEVKFEAYDSDNPINNHYINIQMSFLELNIQCSQATITLHEDALHSGIGTSVCGDVVPKRTYKSNLKTMSVNFHKLVPSIYEGHFEILVTKINNGRCKGSEFECGNGACINEVLACDDYDNCGDNSDEVEGCFWTDGVIAGVAIGVIGFIVLVICLVILVHRKIKYGTIADRKWRNKNAIQVPVPKIHSPAETYFSETIQPAHHLVPAYSPSLSPNMTPNLTPQSQQRGRFSTFQQQADVHRVLGHNNNIEIGKQNGEHQHNSSFKSEESTETVPKRTSITTEI